MSYFLAPTRECKGGLQWSQLVYPGWYFVTGPRTEERFEYIGKTRLPEPGTQLGALPTSFMGEGTYYGPIRTPPVPK